MKETGSVYSLSKSLTIVVLASPSPLHPDTGLILRTIDSLTLLGDVSLTNIVIAHDGVSEKLQADLKVNYQEYQRRLKLDLALKPNITIIQAPHFGHLSGNISYALKFVKTKYVLVVQHDLEFTRKVDLQHCLSALEINSKIKHLRFNKLSNYPYVWDCNPTYRKRLYKQENFLIQGKKFSCIKTLGWSDNNHLTTRNYYLDLILPLVGRRKIFPESVANLSSGIFNHRILGNYIYGGAGELQTIFHLDGRGTKDFAEAGTHHKKHLVSHNLLRLSIQIQRVYYKAKLIYLGTRNLAKHYAPIKSAEEAKI